MTKVAIELDIDTVDSIIVKELLESRNSLVDDLKRYKQKDPGWIAIFDTDPKKDKKLIKKHIESFNRILEWYGHSEFD